MDIKVAGYQKIVNGKMVWVHPHDREVAVLNHVLPPAMKKVIPKAPAVLHPEADEAGDEVEILTPSIPTAQETWTDPKATATWTPGSPTPAILNGVPMAPWADHPEDADDWNDVEGQKPTLAEPPMKPGKGAAAGVVIEEPDGRVWIIHPTNQFGGYKATFPKGHTEEGIDLQASAIKEAYEETGLQVEITGYLTDVERTTTRARYYTARRVGGTPAAMGWEAQAISLVPRARLYEFLNMPTDHGLAEKVGGGPRPKLPKAASTPYTPKPWW